MQGYRIESKRKEEILKQISTKLKTLLEIEFAYAYGSFVKEDLFRDIDIAIYIKDRQRISLEHELDLEAELYRKIGFPVDVRVLNSAPNTFCFHAIKEGRLLFCKNESKRAEFESRVFSSYTDFASFRIRYLEEVFNLKYERDKLLNLTGEIRKALRNLEELASLPKEEFLRDVHKISSAKYNFIIAIEGIVDICNHLISQNKLRAPEDYADTFRVLEEAGTLDEEFAGTLIKMVRFRNRLVHLYWKVDDELVYDILATRRGDIEKFLEKLGEVLSK